MSQRRTVGARPQRGRVPQARRANSKGLLYGALAVIVIVVIALAAIANLGGGANNTAQSNGISLTVPIDSLPSRGKADAPVTVVEYADFQCPACAYFSTQLAPSFIQQYIDTGKVRMVFHDFPLGQHRNAVPAAEAARAAGAQGKFWEMHDLLYQRQDEWSNAGQPEQLFVGYAEQLGLDQAAFQQALTSHAYRAEIQKLARDGSSQGVNSTPTFVIDGKPYASNELQAAVDRALAGK